VDCSHQTRQHAKKEEEEEEERADQYLEIV
jgi:hypothetical protein